MRNWLENKTVVLSGASGGIGRELCKLLVEKYRANVIGIGRNQEKMLSLKAELGDNAKRFDFCLFDVSVKENWQTLAEDFRAKNICPAVLINNAGAFPTFKRASAVSSDVVENIMQTNYFSAVYAIEALRPLLSGDKKDKPTIVNVASSAALCSVVGTSAYSASKAALSAYTEALQMEEKGKTYVCLICPGTTATELFSKDENTKNSALDKIAMPAKKMAKKIAKKILRKKKRGVLGWDAKAMSFLTRLMPVKGLFVVRGVMKASGSKVFKEVFVKDETKEENV